eukprot:maker-scaffold_2-augustus-gene-12.59-mRNA-1 protein AED:0.38 eAED:0.40 QI:0/0/0/0.5/0/0.5/2/0/392
MDHRLGAVYKEMEKQDYNKLKEVSLELRRKIIDLQAKADKCGLEHRMKVNKRRNVRGKLKPIYFGVGEFVWLSEKEAREGRRDKLKPRWCGPYQVIECISEHIYVIQDVDGKKKTRHSMLLTPYAPIGFLPNPATSLVYRMDKGKLELDKLMKLVKDDEGQLKFLCRWRGFSENDDTFEPALTIFEDLPYLVIEFCRDNKSIETIQPMDFLMTVYPDSEYLGQIETQKKIFAMNENEVSSFEEKLIFGKMLIDEKGNWNRLNWSTFELQSLRVGLLKHVVEQLFEVNGVKELGRLVWIKSNGKDKIVSTLGNVTMKRTEECIIGVHNSFPKTLIQRNFGKEVFYGKRSGNAQKPTEFYRLIESNFEPNAAKLELFGRKNNLKNGWLVIGDEL